MITNVEADHLDCYKDIDEIVESFRTFARLVPGDGVILVNGVDRTPRKAVAGVEATVQTVAIDATADWCRRYHRRRRRLLSRGDSPATGRPSAQLRLSVAGIHNFFDATMAVAACAACGVDPAWAADALADFRGVDRRMTEVGRYHRAIIVDDYGHHPTEIRTTLKALAAEIFAGPADLRFPAAPAQPHAVSAG